MHKALPQTLTAENLAKWITENCLEKKIHEDRVPLDATQIADLEHRSSNCSRQIDKLNAKLKEIQNAFKDGTQEPMPWTLEPTKGLKVLETNRAFADSCIDLGHTVENTTLYGIPFPAKEIVIFFDIEGNEFPDYQENMTPEQIKYHGSLFKDEESLQEQLSKDQKKKLGGRTERVSPEEAAKGLKKAKMIIDKNKDVLPPSDIGGEGLSPFPLDEA